MLVLLYVLKLESARLASNIPDLIVSRAQQNSSIFKQYRVFQKISTKNNVVLPFNSYQSKAFQ